MIKKALPFIYFVLPSVLASGLLFHHFIFLPFWSYAIFSYLITFIGIVLFFKFNPYSFKKLILSLALSPLIPFTFGVVTFVLGIINAPSEAVSGYPLIFLVAIAFMFIPIIFYALPFIVVAYIARGVVSDEHAI